MENGHGIFNSSGPRTTGSNVELNTVKNIGFENGGFSPTSETSRELNQVQKVPENPHNASCPFVYKDDVVRSSKDDSLVGIVTEVAGDFDSEEEYSESDDDDDDTDDGGGDIDGEEAHNVQGERSDTGHVQKHGDHKNDELLSDGQVRVIWMNDTETNNSLNDLEVVDRGFLHGDIVAAASDPTGQLGLVVDVNISVDLRVSSGAIITDVSSRDLQRVRDFAVGDYVVHGPWLGRVDDILDNVTVLFDDGSICKVLKADPLRLKPASKNILDYSSFPYHPGLRVRAVSSSVYKSGRWLSGLWKPSRLEGTVTKVQVGAVYVYWIASANPGYGSDSTTAPPEEQNPKNLTVLSCFSHANWQLSDWCMFSPTEDRAEIYSHLMSMDHCLGSHTSMSDRSDRKAQSARSGDHINLASKPYTAGDNKTAGNNGLSDSCSNSLPVSRETSHDSLPVSRKKIRKIFVKRDKRVRKREETYEMALQIVNTRTRVVVAWQDGSREFGLDSTSLIPIHTPGDQDFFPEEYVVEKSLDEVVHATEVKRIGVMKTVDAKERTACVTWLKPVSRPEDPREFDGEEIVSLYELDEHPDYDYCYGDVVIRLFPVTVSADLGSSKNQVEEHDRQVNFVEDFDVRSCDHADDVKVDEMLKDCNNVDFSHLSWVGHVTGLGGGDIEVAWADGTVSKVGPQAIYAVARDDDGESFGDGSEVSDDGGSWETVEDNEMNDLDGTLQGSGLQNPTSREAEKSMNCVIQAENSPGRNGPLSFTVAAIGFVTKLASGLLSQARKRIDILGSDSRDPTKRVEQEISDGSGTGGVDAECEIQADNHNAQMTFTASEECYAVSSPAVAEVGSAEKSDSSLSEVLDAGMAHSVDGPFSFKHFDVTKDPLDHHYLDSGGQDFSGRKWAKKVQQEWSILEKNLPDAVYVRVFEDRMDLLRAVIIGTCGTPYQDGLFFFDIHLPPEYPRVPPTTYYHSGGLQINPNLYEDGKVCLSLLNTWTGKGNEVWDPSSSSILQVLVSIQGLVLNAKPYFNEAGYEKQVGTIEGGKNALPYNENTYLLNCKSMIYLLRRPPMHFEGFVKDHFRRRGPYILKACDAYMKGCLVGSLTKDACATDQSNEHSCSVGFRLMLTKIIPKLYSAFSEIGADCSEFEHLKIRRSLHGDHFSNL